MNVAVRAAQGTDGGLVILAAYCPTCRCEAMPDGQGRCCFCERRIVDEDRLSARELIGGIRGNPQPDLDVTLDRRVRLAARRTAA